MDGGKRAERRYQHEKRKANKRRVIESGIERMERRSMRVNHLWENLDSRVGIEAETPCRWSGPYCGNPRRHFGERTIQERRREGEGHLGL